MTTAAAEAVTLLAASSGSAAPSGAARAVDAGGCGVMHPHKAKRQGKASVSRWCNIVRYLFNDGAGDCADLVLGSLIAQRGCLANGGVALDDSDHRLSLAYLAGSITPVVDPPTDGEPAHYAS